MTPRWLPPALLLLAVLLGGALEVAWGQGAPVQGLERLSPEERAVVERHQFAIGAAGRFDVCRVGRVTPRLSQN